MNGLILLLGIRQANCSALQRKSGKLSFLLLFFWWNICRGFRSGELEEELISNMDETAFKIDMDSKTTLDYEG